MDQNLMFDYQGLCEIYIDGCCFNNGMQGAQAGFGVWFNHNHPLNVWAPVRGPPTNNNAEIQAATSAIRQASKIGLKHVKLYTDSQFLINCVTQWMSAWKMNNWTTMHGQPVQNKLSLVALDEAMSTMYNVQFEYVHGHGDSIGNREADSLAKKGARLYH